jgi:hypothetical protein
MVAFFMRTGEPWRARTSDPLIEKNPIYFGVNKRASLSWPISKRYNVGPLQGNAELAHSTKLRKPVNARNFVLTSPSKPNKVRLRTPVVMALNRTPDY